MQRDFALKLSTWKSSTRRKPLIVEGARQVGKTFSIREFGKAEYTNLVELNFEADPSLVELFEGTLDPERIFSVVRAITGSRIDPGSTLIFLDEVQLCERALTSLKYFCEQAPQFHIIAAGSLLGLRLRTATTFPVGKVNFLHLRPMSFTEFLSGVGEESLAAFIRGHPLDEPYPAPIRARLEEQLRTYYFVGGMPEVVATFALERDYRAARTVQVEILRAYLLDFSKYATPAETLKISSIWNSVPGQLAKENKKFVFSAVRESARAREYEGALQWLLDAGLLMKVRCVENPTLPLGMAPATEAFKVYVLDVGLLGALLNLDVRDAVVGTQIFASFRGALAENYVAQSLVTEGFSTLFYWKSNNEAEVDFLIEVGGRVIPVEVKAALHTRAKSLQAFRKRFAPEVAVRTSLQPQKVHEGLYEIPLFAISETRRLLLSDR